MGNGSFSWSVEELTEELELTREAWRVARFLGQPTGQIEATGRRLANEVAAAKANGGYILL